MYSSTGNPTGRSVCHRRCARLWSGCTCMLRVFRYAGWLLLQPEARLGCRQLAGHGGFQPDDGALAKPRARHHLAEVLFEQRLERAILLDNRKALLEALAQSRVMLVEYE